MRKYIKIVESISNEYHINNMIEDRLANYSDEDKIMVRDGLEIILNSRTDVSISTWVSSMKVMWDKNNEELKRIFKLMTSDFSDMITRTDFGMYRWAPQNTSDDDIDMDSNLAKAAKMQIQITSFIQDKMKTAGRFTVATIAAMVEQQTNLPAAMATELVRHTIDQSAATVKRVSADVYEWAEHVMTKTADEHMSMWKDFARRAGNSDKTDI